MKYLVLILGLLLITATVCAEEVEHFCDDPQAEAEWETIIKKYPKDLNVQTLHALRIGLCEKIEREEIGLPEAIAIFEAMRSVAVNRAFQKRLQGTGEESDL